MNDALLYLHLVLAVLICALLLAAKVRRWRRLSAAAALLLLLTGAHNFATRMQAPPPGWHALAGIKALAGLHALAMVFLLARGGPEEKERRWRKSALISAGLTLGMGLYLSNILR
ncbi:MAG: hypothetical protein N2036_04820 [Bryobacteraceae bacterium]|nr:hypothetical protein [Bryobacteraceae bacterium]MCX7603382.1 hypothetical protein [Bryobacteraceae bacterium]